MIPYDPTLDPRHHDYLSTACLHSRHNHCQAGRNLEGEPKHPGHCKWCDAPCICHCHVGGDSW